MSVVIGVAFLVFGFKNCEKKEKSPFFVEEDVKVCKNERPTVE
jgi:hypothetical protein